MPAARAPQPAHAVLAWVLPLVDEPFAALGRPLGLSADAVLEMLRAEVARGRLLRVGPVFRPGEPVAAQEQPLVDLLGSGLPLVPRPYEAVAAVLGGSAQQVRETLALWLAQGRLLRIGAVPGP